MPKLLSFDIEKHIQQIENWIDKNRQERKYTFEDSRHSRETSRKSALLSSKQHADELLKTAIGDIQDKGRLYNWDENHNTYIIFEDEYTPQNSYYAYHFDPNKPRNIKIPDNIKKRLKR